jgi:hypothetical protein
LTAAVDLVSAMEICHLEPSHCGVNYMCNEMLIFIVNDASKVIRYNCVMGVYLKRGAERGSFTAPLKYYLVLNQNNPKVRHCIGMEVMACSPMLTDDLQHKNLGWLPGIERKGGK